MVRQVLTSVMEVELSRLTGASHGEQSHKRSKYRNGYRDRAFDTRVGKISLAIPRVPKGSYFPGFLEARRRSSEVSRICTALDKGVTAFRTMPLTKNYPYVWLDANYHKVREGDRVVFMANVVAYSLAEDDYREVIGTDVGPSEDGAFCPQTCPGRGNGGRAHHLFSTGLRRRQGATQADR